MPTSTARILANQKNALLSTGPRTAEGKAISRRNSLKHGLTGEGIALPVEDEAEVERIHKNFEAELKPSSALSRTLVRRLAMLAIRLDRCVAYDTASLTNQIEEAEIAFDLEWPESEGDGDGDSDLDPIRQQLRVEAAHRALFDTSHSAVLARRYEAAAERGFFRCLKELRLIEKAAKPVSETSRVEAERASLASSFEDEMRRAADALAPIKPASKPAAKPTGHVPVMPFTAPSRVVDVDFAIGRAR